MTDTDNTPPSFTWLSSRLSGHLSRSVQHQLSVSGSRRVSRTTHMSPPSPLGGSGCNGGEGGEATAITLVLLPGNRLPDCRTVPMRDPGAVPTNDCKYPITPPPLPPSAGPPASHPRPGAPIVLPRSETLHTRSQPLTILLLQFSSDQQTAFVLSPAADGRFEIIKSSWYTMQQPTRNQASNFCSPISSDLNLQPVSC